MKAFFRLYTDFQLSWLILKVELKSRTFQIQHGQDSYKIQIILFIGALRPENFAQLAQRLKFANTPFIAQQVEQDLPGRINITRSIIPKDRMVFHHSFILLSLPNG